MASVISRRVAIPDSSVGGRLVGNLRLWRQNSFDCAQPPQRKHYGNGDAQQSDGERCAFRHAAPAQGRFVSPGPILVVLHISRYSPPDRFTWPEQVTESGEELPRSAGTRVAPRQQKAAMNRRTPRKRLWSAVIHHRFPTSRSDLLPNAQNGLKLIGRCVEQPGGDRGRHVVGQRARLPAEVK